MTRVVTRVEDLADHSAYGTAGQLFAPAMEGFPAGLGSVLSILPIHDANGRLLSEVARLRSAPRLRVGVFAADQLRTTRQILRELHASNVEHVVTWPTVAMLGAEVEHKLAPLHAGYEREVAFAKECTCLGWSVTGTVMDRDQAVRMLDAGCRNLLFHPPVTMLMDGFARPEALERFAAVAAVAREQAANVSFYCEARDLRSVPSDLPFTLEVFCPP